MRERGMLPWLVVGLMTTLACAPAPVATEKGAATESAAVLAPDAASEPRGGSAADGAISPEAPSIRMICRGNEPFWSLEIDGDRALLQTPEAMNENARAFAGRASRDESGALVWQGALADASIRIRIEERECRDSMSDETPPTPYMGVLTLPEGNEGPGCCQTLVR